jgi:hypothetical protein
LDKTWVQDSENCKRKWLRKCKEEFSGKKKTENRRTVHNSKAERQMLIGTSSFEKKYYSVQNNWRKKRDWYKADQARLRPMDVREIEKRMRQNENKWK